MATAKRKLANILAALACLVIGGMLAAAAIVTVSGREIIVGGPLYKRVMDARDLISDILPPPAYVIEAYLEATLAVRDGAAQPARVERLRQLRADYDSRLEYWRHRDIDPTLRTLLYSHADRHAQRFWQGLEQDLLPALGRGDSAAAVLAYDRLEAAYKDHRAVIDRLVVATQAASHITEMQVGQRQNQLLAVVAATALLTLLLLVICMLIVRQGLSKPIWRLTALMRDLAAGKLQLDIPFLHRRDEIGEIARALAVFRDTACEKAELAEEAERFSLVLAHHLQEPVRHQLIYADLVRSRWQEADALPGEVLHIWNAARRLRQLIADAQTYLGIPLRAPPGLSCQAEACLQQAVAAMQPELDAAGARCLAAALPAVAIDGAVLTEIFSQVLANALRFRAHQRPLLVRVAWEACDGRLLFTVSDNGIGIDPEHRERVFWVFERLRTDQPDSSTGIGLSIVRKLVRGVGGTAWIEDGEDGGCRVCFILPALPA